MTDITWRKSYKERTVSVSQALAKIPDGSTIFIAPGAAEPRHLVDNLLPIIENKGLKLLYGWSLRPPVEVTPHSPKPSYFYLTKHQLDAFREGKVDSIPLNISQIPILIQRKIIPIDVALVQLGAPDPHGQMSLGVSVGITRAALYAAPMVIAQVNSTMPRTHGSSFVDFRSVNYFVKHSVPLQEITPTTGDTEVEAQLGRHLNHLIPDGSTIQIGQGRVPSSTVRECFNKKNIGIHSLMISDWAMQLMEAGTVGGENLTPMRNKVVASFAMGTKRFYEFLHDSPLFDFRETDYLNDPAVIAQHDRFISINGAHKIDLTGQVFNKERPIEYYSNIGGVGEIPRNVLYSPGGRNIMVLSSRDKNGESNIIPFFDKGEGLLLTRADVDYVVTEYGFVRLRNLSLRQRALRLIELAHPKFRPALIAKAIELNHINENLPIESLLRVGSHRYTTLPGGGSLLIRSASIASADRARELFYSLDPSELAMRFFQQKENITAYLERSFSQPGYCMLMAFIEGSDGEHPVGIIEWTIDPNGPTDIALVVSPSHRRLGIARALVTACLTEAKATGAKTFQAEVYARNRSMLQFMGTLSPKWSRKELESAVLFQLSLA